jgi:hypothetical protein
MEVKPNLIKHKGVKNSDIRSHVDALHDFETNNKTVYGEKKGKYYVVYSYGEHYPMYVCDFEAEVWLGNNEKSSRTTERHKKHAKPLIIIHQWFNTSQLQFIMYYGFNNYIAKRLEGAQQ